MPLETMSGVCMCVTMSRYARSLSLTHHTNAHTHTHTHSLTHTGLVLRIPGTAVALKVVPSEEARTCSGGGSSRSLSLSLALSLSLSLSLALSLSPPPPPLSFSLSQQAKHVGDSLMLYVCARLLTYTNT